MIELIRIYERDFIRLRIEIYHQTMAVIIKDIFKFFLLCIIVKLRIALRKLSIEDVLMIGIDKSIWEYYSIITGISIDYKEQVVIISIILSM